MSIHYKARDELGNERANNIVPTGRGSARIDFYANSIDIRS